MIGPELSPLENEVSLAAHDFKVSGVGQRTRAALRRNLAAADHTILPDHLVRSVPGPDLVRQLNTLELVRLFGSPIKAEFHEVDREMVSALQNPLSMIRLMVGYLWCQPLESVANAFVGADSIPIPHCTTYPDARSLAGSSEALPRQVARLLDRISSRLQDTSVWNGAVAATASLSSADIDELMEEKALFEEGCQPSDGETMGDWRERVTESLRSASTQVPSELLAVERLISASVEALVSLASWDHEIDVSAVRQAQSAEIAPYLPNGFELSMSEFTDLAFLAMGSAFRLKSEGRIVGVGATAASHFEFSQGHGEKLDLSVIRLCSYESMEGQ